MTAQSLFEKVWQRHVVVPETADTPAILYIDLHLDARGHVAAGVRRAAGPQAQGPPARPHARDDGPLDADRHGADLRRPADQARIGRQAGAPARGELRRVRREPDRAAGPAPRHRAHHRARTGRHAARQDHRLRRQPHQHARRVRRPRLRHRHHRSRLRAGHAVPAAAQAEDARDRRATAGCRPACRPRTSCSPSSAGSA